MAIPAQHTTYKTPTILDLRKEMVKRMATLGSLAEVGDVFTFSDSMGTTTMVVQADPSGGFALDVDTTPRA